jgi:hypothetical protein
LLGLLSGCAAQRQLSSGPGLEFDPRQVQSYREAQDKVLSELYVSAGLGKDKVPATSAEWDSVIRAGMDYADVRCEAYLHALFRLNRDTRTIVSQISLMGAATAGVLGAVEAAAKEIALTAIAFGLLGATVENLSNNVLYELEPSSVRTIVRGLQSAYRAGLGTGYSTRPAAVAAMRNYASLCIPSNIEAEVNLAVKKAQPQVKPGDPNTGQPPVATHADVVVTLPAATRAQAQLAPRIDKLMDRVDKLTTAQALALSSVMPFKDDPAYADVFKNMDPNGQRIQQPTIARLVAKTLIVATTKSEDAVVRWETTMKLFD